MRRVGLALLVSGVLAGQTLAQSPGSPFLPGLPPGAPPARMAGPAAQPNTGVRPVQYAETGAPPATIYEPLPAGAGSGTYGSAHDWANPRVPATYHDGCVGPQVWFNADYLLLYMKKTSIPAIAEVFPREEGLARVTADRDRVFRLFPTAGDDNDINAGMRLSVGGWFTPDQTVGAEVTYTRLFERSNPFSFGSDGTPGSAFLSRFAGDTATGQPTSFFVAVPDRNIAGAVAGGTTMSLESWEANGLYNATPIFADQLAVIGGFRYVGVDQRLDVQTLTTSNEPGVFRRFGSESFETTNDFYGGQVGLRAIFQWTRVRFEATTKLAMGITDSSSRIDGSTVVTGDGSFGASGTYPGSFLAQTTNIGTRSTQSLTFIPEITLKCGFRLTDWASVHAGYDLLYITQVATVGSTIDSGVDSGRIPPPGFYGTPGAALTGRPVSRLDPEQFWVQGFNFGIHLQY